MAHCAAFVGIVRGVHGVPHARARRPSRAAGMSVRAGNNPFDATSGAAKRAADTVSDKAKSFWNDEVLGAKKAMERDASKNPGEDVRATVDVTLEQSVLGAEVPLTYSRRRVCPGCGGAGRLPQTFIDCDTCEGNRGTVSEDVSVTVSVPGGVSSGATLRLRDQGDEGSPPGQLYVTVRAAAMSDGAAIVRDGKRFDLPGHRGSVPEEGRADIRARARAYRRGRVGHSECPPRTPKWGRRCASAAAACPRSPAGTSAGTTSS